MAPAVVTKSRKTITGVTLAITGVGDKAFLADASAEYRSHLARVAAKRAIQTALGRAG